MKKTVKSIMASILCVVILLSLAACGGSDVGNSPTDTGTASNGTGNNANSNSSTLTPSGEPIYLSDMLEAGGTRIWFEINSNNIGKDAELSYIYFFKNGELTVYVPSYSSNPDFFTLGDVARMTEEELLVALKEADYLHLKYEQDDCLSGVQSADDLYNLIADAYPDDMSAFSSAVREIGDAVGQRVGYEEFEILYAQAWENSEDMESAAFIRTLVEEIFEYVVSEQELTAIFDEFANKTSFPYTLNVITDSTGNNTKTEKIIYSYENYDNYLNYRRVGFYLLGDEHLNLILSIENYDEMYKSKFPNDEFNGKYILNNHVITLSGTYREGQVYDCLFGGFALEDGKSMFITEFSETLISFETPGNQENPKLDTPDTPGVTVD